MPEHRCYRSIVGAVKDGRLKEPFTARDWHEADKSIPETTWRNFLSKHRKDNPHNNSVLVKRVQETPEARYELIRQEKYGIDARYI